MGILLMLRRSRRLSAIPATTFACCTAIAVVVDAVDSQAQQCRRHKGRVDLVDIERCGRVRVQLVGLEDPFAVDVEIEGGTAARHSSSLKTSISKPFQKSCATARSG